MQLSILVQLKELVYKTVIIMILCNLCNNCESVSCEIKPPWCRGMKADLESKAVF